LTPPDGLEALTSEDRTTSELLYKMRMIGNIRFVGALFVRKMLASKVMLAIMEELLQDPTSEALESLAAFLTVVGPTFDTPDWAYRVTLNAVFAQVEKLAKKKTVPQRVRCLLKDVLDVRSLGWNDKRPKKIDGPLKLQEVAAKAAMENGGVVQKAPVSGGDWEMVGGSRLGKSTLSPSSLQTPQKPEKTTKGTGAGQAMLMFMKARDDKQSPKAEVAKELKPAGMFDKEACRKEINATLAELWVSFDVQDAAERIANAAVPVAHQASELNKMLARIAEEGSTAVRKVGLDLVVRLFADGHWQPKSATKGVRKFVEETCADLKYDVPTLGSIVRGEVHPALASLAKRSLLDPEQHKALLSV